MFALLKRRTYDIAMCTGVQVFFNEELVKENNLQKYVRLYFPEESELKPVFDETQDRWRVVAIYDPTDTLPHEVISFVNGINTYNGGTHASYVLKQIVDGITEAIQKKNKSLTVKPSMITDNLIVFVDTIIENPNFEGQIKEKLMTQVKNFGSSYKVPDKFITNFCKTGIVETVTKLAIYKEEQSLKKTDGSKRSKPTHPKLIDCSKAGTKESHKCRLILTEGDSAASMVMKAGISKEYFGVFPLRGKFINPREMAHSKVNENEEVAIIKQILGLQMEKKYENVNELRYGGIIILTDQDLDGYHIKGLLINFFHYYWPSLDMTDYVQCLPTQIVKVTKGKQSISFMSEPDFRKWMKENNEGKGWTIDYYKGLGTNTDNDVREFFTDLESKLITYTWNDDKYDPSEVVPLLKKKSSGKKKVEIDADADEGENHEDDEDEDEDDQDEKDDKGTDLIDDSPTDLTPTKHIPRHMNVCEDMITLAFDKTRADDRKTWLSLYKPNGGISSKKKRIPVPEFINEELVQFSLYDNIRSIPNIIDGFKPSHRKIFYTSRGIGSIYDKKQKVAQLSGLVAAKTHYHHGENNLNETITKMAQNFCGSNNINLLTPEGQFGSRLMGGKDSAQARYIFVKMNELSKIIFNSFDGPVLEPNFEEKDEIEPKFFVPIIPMILVNGIDGIGTGYSTGVPCFNPRDIVANIQSYLKDSTTKLPELKPWYRFFDGEIKRVNKVEYKVSGKYEIIDDDTIMVTELPVGLWSQKFKEKLIALKTPSEKKQARGVKKGGKAAKAGKTTQSKNPQSAVTKGKGSGSKSATGGASKNEKESKGDKQSDAIIKDFNEDLNNAFKVNFVITFHPGQLKKLLKSKTLEKKLGLVSKIKLTNMYLFDENSMIKKFKTPNDIIKHHAKVRLEYYEKRKKHLLDKWDNELKVINYRIKFLNDYQEDVIVITKKTKSTDLIEQLEKLKYPRLTEGAEETPSYNYLTKLRLWDLTQDEMEKLKKKYDELCTQIENLKKKKIQKMWLDELTEFIEAYDKWEKRIHEEHDSFVTNINSENKKRKGKVSKGSSLSSTSQSSKSSKSSQSSKSTGSKSAVTSKKSSKKYEDDDEEETIEL
jgi:DNA topoisomerase-2